MLVGEGGGVKAIPSYFLKFNIIFWLCWVFVIEAAFPFVAASRDSSSCGAGASFVVKHGSRAQAQQLKFKLPCTASNLPRPGIKPVSSALAGRFATNGPPGKSNNTTLVNKKNVSERVH